MQTIGNWCPRMSSTTCRPRFRVTHIKKLRQAAKRKLNGEAVETPGQGLREYLTSLYSSGVLSAPIVSSLAQHITAAGAQGVEDLASKPGAWNKNMARSLGRKWGVPEIQKHKLLYIDVPQRDRGKRAKRQQLAILPIFDVLALLYQKHKDAFMKHVGNPDLLCDNFYKHEMLPATSLLGLCKAR